MIKVSRISAKTEVHKLDIELDVNTDVYPMSKETFYGLCLARSLTADGQEDFDLFRHGDARAQDDSASNIIDQYQYVMNGKIFEDQLSDDGNKL